MHAIMSLLSSRQFPRKKAILEHLAKKVSARLSRNWSKLNLKENAMLCFAVPLSSGGGGGGVVAALLRRGWWLLHRCCFVEALVVALSQLWLSLTSKTRVSKGHNRNKLISTDIRTINDSS